MKESALVRKIVLAVKQQHPQSYVRKLSDRFQRGLPDLLLLTGRTGKFVGLLVEVKVEGGKVSAIQKVEGEELNRLGLLVDGNMSLRWIVAKSVDEVLDTLTEMLK